ncbi:MAG: CheB methylesterase [Ferruginibacter sp.]|nr:CheB methylesterase [Ferruginibacter sp.]
MKIIVIGGSAGSLKSLKQITSQLPRDINAAVFVVIHFPADKTSNLPSIINHDGTLTAEHAEHNKKIEAGKIYVAVPNYHLLIENGKIGLGKGPKENRFRPSIDVLFRSAALEYNSDVIGIVLSGLLDDGTVGLNAIKKMNGIAIVQDPADAQFASMPASALRHVDVDHCLPASSIAPIITSVINQPIKDKAMEKDESLQWENDISRGINKNFADMEKYGHASRYICPDCEGPLFRMKDDKIKRYRCFLGHAFTSDTLLDGVTQKIEQLLWTTYRTLDEKREMIESDPEKKDLFAKENEKLISQLKTMRKLLE